MSSNNSYNFSETKLGADFASDKLKEFKTLINAGISFVVLSLPGVGVSYFLRYLATRDFATFIHVDLYSLPSLSQQEFYKLLLKELGGKSKSIDDGLLLGEIKKTLTELTKKEEKIVIIFSRFDQLKSHFDPNFLSNLQSLTTLSPGKIVLIFTSTKPLYEIAADALTGGNLNFYSETLYFKPFAKTDLVKLLQIEPARPVPKTTLDHLLDLSGGHNQLFRILLSSQKQQNLLLDQFVKMQLKELLDYLNYHQRKILQKIALGKTVEEMDEYLLGIGMVKEIKDQSASWRTKIKNELFTPLLEEYIKTHLPIKLPVKEAKLLKLLRKNIGTVVSKDEIFQEVWGENGEVSDWALDALIYRLRKHPFFKAGGYIIESQKKIGYTLIQA